MVARAMANFGLDELRLIAPRDGWPNEKACARRRRVLSTCWTAPPCMTTCATLSAICTKCLQRRRVERGQAKAIIGADAAAADIAARLGVGEEIGVLFGPERTGSRTTRSRLLTRPSPSRSILPSRRSIWRRQCCSWATNGSSTPTAKSRRRPQGRRRPAARWCCPSSTISKPSSTRSASSRPITSGPVMVRNMRDIFHRLAMTEQDVRTLRGAIVTLVQGRRGGHNRPVRRGGGGSVRPRFQRCLVR